MIKFRLDKSSPVPFYRQIIDTVLSGVSTGLISPGEKLPTIREASVGLEVNPNTIAKAYSQLRLMGSLDTQQGSGVFVRAVPQVKKDVARQQKKLRALCDEFIGRGQMLNVGIDELIECLCEIRTEAAKQKKYSGK